MIKKFLIDFFDSKHFIRGNVNRNDELGALHKAWGYVFTNQLHGSYYEFGVYQGKSMINSYLEFENLQNWNLSQLKSDELWRRKKAESFLDFKPQFVGFDSFSGIPDNNEGKNFFKKGDYKSDYKTTTLKIKKIFKKYEFELVQGLFSEIEMRNHFNKAAIINIDSDLYESCIDALNYCKSLFQMGTVLLLDDFYCFNSNPNMGEQKALKDFEIKNDIKFEKWFNYKYAGQAFITIKN